MQRPIWFRLNPQGPSKRIEQLWRNYFSNASQGWDNMFDKKILDSLDFKKGTTKEALWFDNRFNATWIHARLCQAQIQSLFSTSGNFGQAVGAEQLWQEFLSDPSLWWDNRSNKKISRKLLDIEDQNKNDALSMDGWWNPPGVKAKIARGQQQSIARTKSHYAFNDAMSYRALTQVYNRDVSKLCQEGQLEEAMQIIGLMVHHGIRASIKTYVYLLQHCIRMKALAEGKRVHAHIVQIGLDSNIVLGNILVNMYAKCGSLLDARRIFDIMPEHDVFSWTAIISAYAKQGQGEEALNLFQKMQVAGVAPDKVVFVFVLKACASMAALERGKQIHARVIQCGLESDLFVGSILVDMYSKCGCLDDARRVFNKLHARDVVVWTIMIAGYVQQGHCKEALALFEQMQQEGMKPDHVTFVSIIKTCASLGALEQGKWVHAQIINNGFEADLFVGSALIDMYSKCGSIQEARQVFDRMPEKNVVSWNAMIAGYAQQGHGEEALTLFEQMQQEGMNPDNFSFASILKACANLAALERGKQVHAHAIKSGFESDIFVKNTLVDMYAKCGSMDDACQVFKRISERNVVSWTAMIAGYAQQGYGEHALTLFEQMQQEGVKPNNVTFASILKACASLAALERGKRIHAQVIESGFESDVSVGNSLVGMYAKCGRIEDARKVFDRMCNRDVVSWNAMIAGYAHQGHGEEALILFENMQCEGMKPDDITFVSVLSACSHAGLVDEGYHHFNSMSQDHGITPTMEHYTCMVDLLSRAGHLDQAKDLINRMPIQPNAMVWMALLGACRSHANVELGRHAFECIRMLDPKCAGAYVSLSNIYAGTGRWDEVAKIRKEMDDAGVKKEPGCSWIEVKNDVHAFFVADRTHPQSKEIQDELKTLTGEMKKAGYVPNLSLVLHDMWDERKEDALCNHSEKLAIGFGLISTAPGMPICIKKNLRVCGDCHNATKIISKVVGREIIARDANRFHQFKDGVCSCRDYW